MNSQEWLKAFEKGVKEEDLYLLVHLLKNVPSFETQEEAYKALLLSMDAENIINNLHRQLTKKKEDLILFTLENT